MTTTGLQCPGCGHVHPLGEVAGQERFRCTGCRRLLSVPESLAAPAPDGDATRAHPAATPDGTGAGRRGAAAAQAPAAAPAGAVPAGAVPAGAAPRLPAAVRAPVWVLSLALGFAISAGLLRAVGVIDVDAVLDAFAGEGVGRYSVLVVLLPLWAVLSAGAAHVVLEWAGRRRAAGH